MLTRRYKQYEHTRAQATQQFQEVKALPWNITLTCEQSVAQNAGPSLHKRVWRNANPATAFDMSMDHLGNGTGLSRLHEALMIYMLLPICTQFCYANGDPRMQIF
jgi:hypothetical protein